MERLMEGRTVFLIAPRLRSDITADLILVLDEGRLVESGTHLELLHRGGIYTRLFNEQTRGLRLQPRTADYSTEAFPNVHA